MCHSGDLVRVKYEFDHVCVAFADKGRAANGSEVHGHEQERG